MRAVRVLDQMGRYYIDEPQRIKYLLAPVIAKNQNEQQRFYEVFDQFWTDITTTPLGGKIEDEPPPPVPSYFRWLGLIPLLIVCGLIYILWPEDIKKPEPRIFFETKREVAEGDSVNIVLLTENIDTNKYNFNWIYLDSLPDKPVKPIFQRRDKTSWSFIMNHPGEKGGRKFSRLIVRDSLDQVFYFQQQEIKLRCKSPPEISGSLSTARANKDERVSFNANIQEPEKYRYEWQFGDGESSDQANPWHIFKENGAYTVRLRVWNPAHAYPCEAFAEHQISIGPEKAYLSLRLPAYDEVTPSAYFSQLYWLLIGFLGLTALYWIGRWSKRPFPPDPKEQRQAALSARFATVDQAPYFIPFRSQNERIVVSSDLYRLATVLRLREEGVGKKIDIKRTIHRTVEGGGFPEVALASKTQPTEYLVLIDEKAPESHQARLFKYLTSLLKDQDVLVEVFYYHENFNWFWDDKHPKGISAENLYRMHPHHRLIVMGDAHELLDPFAKEAPELREKEERFIRQWQHRLLFSPLPQTSWTYREKVLYRLFYCFSADTEGLSSAADFLESLAWEEDTPPDYKRWIRQLKYQPDPDTNYRRWRNVKDHQKYLEDRPDLLSWVYALAVFPKPSWETTIAIGKAMGATVTYNNLLVLSRIPWLQKGELNPRLQQAFLQQLSPEQERMAREAVLEELSAVQEITEGSYANLALKTGIAIQAFSLHPEQTDKQEELRFLLDQKLLNKKQIAELNGQIRRQPLMSSESSSFTKAPSVITEEPKGIHEYLEQKEKEAVDNPPPSRPLYTREWYFAVASSAVFILLFFASLYLNKTDRLYQLAFGQAPVASVEHANRDLMSFWGLVEEKQEGNPAALLNNEAVSAYETMLNFIYRDNANLSPENEQALRANQLGIANRNLTEAIDQYPDYELARINYNKIQYNQGVEAFNKYLTEGSEQPELLTKIFYWQNPTLSDSLRLDVYHGAGLSYYYNNQLDSAQVFLDQIETRSDRLYFDTLSNFPNLRSLLFRGQPALQIAGKVYAEDTGQPLSGVSITVIDPQLVDAGYTISTTSNSGGSYELNLPAGYLPTTTLLQYTRTGYTQQDQKVVFESDSSSLSLRTNMKRETASTEVVSPDTSDNSTNPIVNEPGNIPANFVINSGDLPAARYLWCIDPGLSRREIPSGTTDPLDFQSVRGVSPRLEDGRNLLEYEFNWDICQKVMEGLKRYRRESWIVMTDPYDSDDPAARIKNIISQESSLPKVIVSIQLNSIATNPARPWASQDGIETWYNRDNDESGFVADIFQQFLLQATDWADGNVESKRSDILSYSEMPAVITKCGYYTNKEQLKELLKEDVRQRIADAHIAAILEIERTGIQRPQEFEQSPPEESNSFRDPRDGQSYTYKRMRDGKNWMTQNLNIEIEDSWCYDNEDAKCGTYGRLYTWEAAQNACPKGWRLPSDEEWRTMTDFYGGATDNEDIRTIVEQNEKGLASYKALIDGGSGGFSAQLGGYRELDRQFINIQLSGHFWTRSTTEQISDQARSYTFDRKTSLISQNNSEKNFSYSCRCIQD